MPLEPRHNRWGSNPVFIMQFKSMPMDFVTFHKICLLSTTPQVFVDTEWHGHPRIFQFNIYFIFRQKVFLLTVCVNVKRSFLGCSYCAVISESGNSTSYCYSNSRGPFSDPCRGLEGTHKTNNGVVCNREFLAQRTCEQYTSCTDCLARWPSHWDDPPVTFYFHYSLILINRQVIS